MRVIIIEVHVPHGLTVQDYSAATAEDSPVLIHRGDRVIIIVQRANESDNSFIILYTHNVQCIMLKFSTKD